MELHTSYDLTIVTVCRNVLYDIQHTVRSVLCYKAQTAYNIEHLVIDGLSTDGTADYIAIQAKMGHIENYISEADKGIYDAMNKAVRLARGKLLLFINAGDRVYTDNNQLDEAIHTLLLGKADSIYAESLLSCNGQIIGVRKPYPKVKCLVTACCHQAYLTHTAYYREIGGYDTEHYRCIADSDVMYKIASSHSRIEVMNAPISIFETGGFSSVCEYQYAREFFRLIQRNWITLLNDCRKDTVFAHLTAHFIANRCRCFNSCWETAIPDETDWENLRRMVQELKGLSWGLKYRISFLVYQYGVLIHPRNALFHGMPQKMIRLVCCMVDLPDKEPDYGGYLHYSWPNVWSDIKQYIKKVLHIKRVPHPFRHL